jgi:hypothetical protein
MAVVVEFRAPSGRELFVRLFPYGSDTAANTSLQPTTEATNRRGIYTFIPAPVSGSLAGWYTAHIFDTGGAGYIGVYDIFLAATDGVYRAEDAPITAHAGRQTLDVNLTTIQQDSGSVLRLKNFFGSLIVFNVAAGSSTIEVRTDLTQADNFWDGATMMFTSGPLQNVVRLIESYDQTNGAFTLDEALPSVPQAAVTGIILGRITT